MTTSEAGSFMAVARMKSLMVSTLLLTLRNSY